MPLAQMLSHRNKQWQLTVEGRIELYASLSHPQLTL
jgi:hypothetical protein